jgi:hypothetical protein
MVPWTTLRNREAEKVFSKGRILRGARLHRRERKRTRRCNEVVLRRCEEVVVELINWFSHV